MKNLTPIGHLSAKLWPFLICMRKSLKNARDDGKCGSNRKVERHGIAVFNLDAQIA